MPDYGFYEVTYSGCAIPAEDFPRLIRRAWETLTRYKRIYRVAAPDDQAECMAACAMADTLYFYESAQNGTGGSISSASIGSVSVSYGNGNALDASPAAQEREMYRSAQTYLDIYRGC